MRRLVFAAALALAGPAALIAGAGAPEWAMNATVIEACSCPMFCQCYFNAKPASHGGAGHDHHGGGATHFCRANNAYKVNKGHYGDVALDGAKFWIATDLGGDFSKGEMDWAVLYFDKALSQPQRAAIEKIAGQLFPVKWRSFKTAEGSIDTWQYDKDQAVALLDGGKTGEVRLKRFPGMTDEPVVIKNLRYWGAPRNDGFIMMPNEVEAYRVGDKAFEFRNSNGFMLTLDITSKDVAK
jgi:hypothetical protein